MSVLVNDGENGTLENSTEVVKMEEGVGDLLEGGDALESKGGWSGISDYDYHGEEDGYNANICPYPTYYTYFTVLILLAATLLAQVPLVTLHNCSDPTQL